MANERSPWMLTAGQLRAALRDVPEHVVVAYVGPPDADGLSVIQAVQASYTGGPVFRLAAALPAVSETRAAGDHALNELGFAVARAAGLEARVRLLVQRDPRLAGASSTAELPELCRLIAERHAAALSAADRAIILALPDLVQGVLAAPRSADALGRDWTEPSDRLLEAVTLIERLLAACVGSEL